MSSREPTDFEKADHYKDLTVQCLKAADDMADVQTADQVDALARSMIEQAHLTRASVFSNLSVYHAILAKGT